MADDERMKKLEGRLEQLENRLGGQVRREVSEISAEDLETYRNVRDVLAIDYGEFCGINDCFRCRVCVVVCHVCQVCQLCSVCKVCRVCDVECSCGPCIVSGPGGGVGRFSAFGD